MEASVRMWIKKRPHLSPTMYKILWSLEDFKADMHNVYIKVNKDLVKNCTKLPFIVIYGAIFAVLDSWPPEWQTPNIVEHNKTVVQKQKDSTKLLAQQKCNE